MKRTGRIIQIVIFLLAFLMLALLIKESKKRGAVIEEQHQQEVAASEAEKAAKEEAELAKWEEERAAARQKRADEKAAKAEAERLAEEAEALLEGPYSKMTLEERVDQLFILTPEMLTGEDAVTSDEEQGVTYARGGTKDAILKNPVGGLVYTRSNLVGEESTVNLLSNTRGFYEEANLPTPFLCVTEEGGSVTSIGGRTQRYNAEAIPDMAEYGASEDPNRATRVGNYIGSYLAPLGFNMNFAPVADVLTNQDNTSVALRSFGGNAEVVKSMVEANSDALITKGVVPVWKHFPNLGATTGDANEVVAVNDRSKEDLMSSDLLPYVDAKEKAPAIMVSHIALSQVDGDRPATFSKAIVTDLLRGELGYDGLIITDALSKKVVTDMYDPGEAAVAAITAGCDMILMPADFEVARTAVLHAIEEGSITEVRLNESVARILKVKSDFFEEKEPEDEKDTEEEEG